MLKKVQQKLNYSSRLKGYSKSWKSEMIETEFQEAALREELETSQEYTVAQKSYVYFHFQHFQLPALNFPFYKLDI